MPIDPSIPLGFRSPEPVDYNEIQAKRLQLEAMKRQNRMGKLQETQTQQSMWEEQQFKDALQRGADRGELYGISPKLAATWDKSELERRKADLETQEKQFDLTSKKSKRLSEIVFNVKDQPTLHSAIGQALSEGLIDANEATTYLQQPWNEQTAQHLQAIGQRAMSVAEQNAAAAAKAKAEREAAAAAREAELHPLKVQEQAAAAKLKTAEAAGQAPIQPAQQAQIDAQREAAKATNDYRKATLAQGAQRLGLEGARLNLERTKVGNEEGALERVAQELAKGDLTRLSDIASLRGEQRLKLYDRVKQINPNWNQAEVNRKIKNEEYYTVGKGGDTLRSFGTFLEHAGAASDAVNNIRLASSPAINQPLNWWRANMSGSPEFQHLMASVEPVKKELESFLLGGHALQADDRKAADVILNAEKHTPAQLQAALKTVGHTAQARFNEENYKYKRVSGRDLTDPFSPEAIEGARKIGLNFGGQQQQSALTKPKVGDRHKDDDGTEYVFLGGDEKDPNRWKKAR